MKEQIIYNIASYKRKDTLLKTIESVYNQCDKINVMLNDYTEIPKELIDNKISAEITDNIKGDAYKFLKLTDSNGYFFTIDDDLLYPKNYSDFMINGIEKYKRKSIVTLHGRNFKQFPIKSYYKDSNSLHHFNKQQNIDLNVLFGGTGVMAFHTDLFKVDIDYFKHPNMADIWIGKYAYENKIEIKSLKRDKNFVVQQNIDDSIWDVGMKNDTIQTKIVNETFDTPLVSVVIPTFNNVDYIDECLTSIVKSCGDSNFEILVGIDNCKKTLEHILKGEYDSRIKFHFFKKNYGPYVIKNTLSKISKTNDILLFFDSDDVMRPNMVSDTIKDMKSFPCIKPMYNNFEGVLNINNPNLRNKTKLWGEGVFAIKKKIFMDFNGFEPWRCGADSDFMVRLRKNKIQIKPTEEQMFYHRVHPTSLTVSPETGFKSKVRKEYVKLMEQKKDFGPLKILTLGEYEIVENKTKKFEGFNDNINNESHYQKSNVDKLMGYINHTPKKKVNVDYQKINETIRKHNVFNPKEHVKEQIKEIPKSDPIIPKNDSITKLKKEMFKDKPKRKGVGPNIFGNNQRRKGGFTI